MNKPENYGSWWESDECTPEWYEFIRGTTPGSHAAFEAFAEVVNPSSVLEVGCGKDGHYPWLFSNVRYVGCDVAKRVIEHCRSNHPGEFWLGDIIDLPITEQFDLVFSHAVIDHVADVDAFLENLSKRSSGSLYVRSYRSWRPDLTEHVQTWSEGQACFFNDLSPERLRETLRSCGWPSIQVCEMERTTGHTGHETTIICQR